MSDSATGLLKALQNGEKIAPHVDDLVKKQADLLTKEDNEIKKTFREIEKSLKTFQNLKEDSPVLLRHQEVLSEYSKRVRELNQSIEAIKEASEKKVRLEDFKKKVEELLERTERYRPKEEYRLHSTGQLPWKTKERKEVLLLGAVSDAPQGGAPPITQTSPSADDLSSTIDVQITPEIQALAASLNDHPLDIFRHVYNEYRYTPYYGSMKGSLDTYWEKEGNDYDLASLLIALLRASGIPARYVKAKVQVPIDRIQKWVGIDDPMAALIYLATADIPLVGFRQGAQIRYAEIEHVYVEAYVPYSNYRGTGQDDRGKLWVPMDPSLKEYRIVQDGVDLFAEMGVDWKTISDEYIGELRNITPIEYYRQRIEKQITQTHSGQSLDNLKRLTSLQTRQFDFLPNTLPYAVVEVLDRFAQIPPELRHRVRLQIPSILDQTLSLPEISGRRITLTFSGATADDQAVIDQYGGIFKVPPYLVRVIPILRINGVKVAEGASMETAISYSFTIDYTPPGGEAERFDHHILAGSFNAIGITTGKVRPEFLTIAQVEESEESYLPKMLHSLVMKYHHQINQSRELLKDTMRMQSRTFIIESLVSTFQQRQTILGGIPIRFEFTGFTIDAKEMLSASIPIDGKNLEKKSIDFAMVHGHEASYQENRVFEESMFWMGGTSAIKGLQFLKAEGIPIVELTPHQIYANPNLPEVVLDDINNALNMGWNVTVPEEIGDLPAVPYIKYDAKTGSAGYMIATLAGGLAQEITPVGHETDLTFMRDVFQASQIRLTPSFVFPESPYSLPLGQSVLVGFQVVADGPRETHQESSRTLLFDTERTHYRPGRWPIYAVLPGEYKFKFDGRDLFVLNVWGILAEVIDQDDPENSTFQPLSKSKAVYGGSIPKTSDNLRLTVPLPALVAASVTEYRWSVSGLGSEAYSSPGSSSEWNVGEIKPIPGVLTFTVDLTFANGTTSHVARDIEVGIRTDDIVVIAWIDETKPRQTLNTLQGVSPQLLGTLNTLLPGLCHQQLLDWQVGRRTSIFNDIDRQYANAFLVANSANNQPPRPEINPDIVEAGGDFRAFNRFKVSLKVKSGKIVELKEINPRRAIVGRTPDPCRFSDPIFNQGPSEARPHNLNNKFGVTRPGTQAFNLNQGRIGEAGQAVDRTLNACTTPNCEGIPYGPTTPFIWSIIQFDVLGNMVPLVHQAFPTYSVYRNGIHIEDFTQEDLELFISKDETSQIRELP